MTHRRGRRLGLVRRALTPWTRVATFSADRAGLLSAGALEPALRALAIGNERESVWLPRPPDMELRTQGLREFDKSVVVTRLRVLSARSADGAQQPSIGPDLDESGQPQPPQPTEPDLDLEAALRSAWSLARCDQRLTRRLRLL